MDVKRVGFSGNVDAEARDFAHRMKTVAMQSRNR
jgi:hypothetical protein